MLRAIESNWLNLAVFFFQFCVFINGVVPDEYDPGSLIDFVTKVLAVTITLSHTST
jgi:hypothetical protein